MTRTVKGYKVTYAIAKFNAAKGALELVNTSEMFIRNAENENEARETFQKNVRKSLLPCVYMSAEKVEKRYYMDDADFIKYAKEVPVNFEEPAEN